MAQSCPQCGGDLPTGGFQGLCPRCVALCSEEFESLNPLDHGGTDQAVPGEDAQVSGSSGAVAGWAWKDSPGASAQRVFDYELLEEIGRGGMGVVFRARQLSLNRIVAVKTILSGPVANVEAVRRFRGEAEALARLKHPNIVGIYDVFQRDGLHYFSMEYVPGKSLAHLVQEHPLSPAVAARYAQKVARAIQFAHENGLLHRDLKPSNILVDSFDEPRVTDFGLAKRLNADADLSYTGQLVGSPQYFAPEQLSPKKGEVGPRADVYSLGAVLYHLITGRPPFNASSLEEVLLKVIDTEPPPPRSVVREVPRDLETICLKCLEKEPLRRYATAGEVADDLGRFLGFETIKARPVSVAERSWRWCKRRPALIGAWATALLLLTAFLLVLSSQKPNLQGIPPVTLPLTVAAAFNDRLLFDTNWTLRLAGSTIPSEVETRRITGYTNPPFPICTNAVREMKYQVGSNSTLLAFHLSSDAVYDPAWRGEIKELASTISAHQIDGAGNTRVAPCLEQDGRLYSYTRPQAVSTYVLADVNYRAMTADDFSVPTPGGYALGYHPDFSFRGKPIRFGYIVRDTDPKRGHFGWLAVGSFSLMAFGPAPATFPFSDPALEDRDWSVHALPNGSPANWKETRELSGGNPGKYLRLGVQLGDRTGLDLIHLSRRALYCPASQRALASIDVSLDTRMAPETSGRSANPNLCPVILQNGAVYAAGWRMATFSDQNGGWSQLDFVGLGANHFIPYIGLPRPSGAMASPDFSTNGAPILFGFATQHVTFYNNPAGHAFSMAIDFDNFRVNVHPVPPSAPSR